MWLLWIYVGVAGFLWTIMTGFSLSDESEKQKASVPPDAFVLMLQWLVIAAMWPVLLPVLFWWFVADWHKGKV